MEFATNTSELALWRGVLSKAILDATMEDPKGDENKRAKRDAINWFTRDTKDFRRVCEYAGIDPALVRDAFMSGRIDRASLKAQEAAQ